MVNSSTCGSEKHGNTKASCMQTNGLHNKTISSPLTASSATPAKNDFLEIKDSYQSCRISAVEPTPSQTKFDKHKTNDNDEIVSSTVINSEPNETKKTLFCSFPLEKVQTVLSNYTSFKSGSTKMKTPRKVLCLFCDRTFVNFNLRQKHVERCHSSKQLRRVSLRKHQNFLTNTPCNLCDKFTSTEQTLKDLFKHLVENHSNKYFGCLSCEIRFQSLSHLADHNAVCHMIITTLEKTSTNRNLLTAVNNLSSSSGKDDAREESIVKTGRKKPKMRKQTKLIGLNSMIVGSSVEEETKSCNSKNLRNKKLTVKSSRMVLKRSKRLQAKGNDPPNKRRTKDLKDKKKSDQLPPTICCKLNEKTTKTISGFVNPYPEFDHFFQVKKITDHSIDNLKISSLTFDDVFDKAFFNRIKCNIQENLLHYIDGKLFKNEESENRISNFEKNSSAAQEMQNLNSENYGCELSLNAIAPTTTFLSNQIGDDPESQIEYASKPSKKKTQMKKDEIHYKYFTRRKYQASILEHKENRDLSKLDMWTQYIIKNRQEKIIDDKRSPKEILDYFASEEYKNKMRREELNKILDRRGPFEDLKEEVSKRVALDKLDNSNSDNVSTNDEQFIEIGELLNDILNRVFELAKGSSVSTLVKNSQQHEENISEIPSYLNLRPIRDVIPENEIDRSDKIALICSSQETENFELPSNTVRGKDEKVELTGEWARSRIYVCAACGLKLQNIKQFLEHKSVCHHYIWVQHYEFVGNQSELYRHLSIPVLGKVGVLESIAQSKVWKRSDSRLCTKCAKQCNSLGELHRHILECGGDWTWMLARKKCKYRPFGAKSRRKRRGLVKRIYAQKTECSPAEKKVYKKTYDIPRQKPSDADTIKRMLANLPPKRATRKIMSLKDGFNTSRTRQVKATKQSQFKCGKLIRGKTGNNVKNEYGKNSKSQNNSYRRSLRCLNKVLTSRILDTNSSLIARRRYTQKLKSTQQKKDKIQLSKKLEPEITAAKLPKASPRKLTKANNNLKTQPHNNHKKEELKSKRCSPRIERRLQFNTSADQMNIKRFFPVKKRKKMTDVENVKSVDNTTCKQVEQEIQADDTKQESKSKKEFSNISEEMKNDDLTTSVNLRKRKHERNAESIVTKKSKLRTTSFPSKTMRLRNNVKNVAGELSLQNIDDTKKVTELQASENFFFGKSPVEDNIVVEKCSQSLNVSTPNTVCETSDVFEVAEKLNGSYKLCIKESHVEINSPSNLTNDSLSANISQSFQSLSTKRKVKKPVRGLNDCIAMLTSKLSKKFEQSNTCPNDEGSSQIFSECENVEIMKPEYILKVPFSNEHFHLPSKNIQNECHNTCLNSSEITINETTNVENSSPRNFLLQKGFSVPPKNSNGVNLEKDNLLEMTDCINETSDGQGRIMEKQSIQNDVREPIELNDMDLMILEQCDNTFSESLSKVDSTSVTNSEKATHQLCSNEDSKGMSDIVQIVHGEITRDTDSEDEIPLSSLLKEEQVRSVSSMNEIVEKQEESCGNSIDITNTRELDLSSKVSTNIQTENDAQILVTPTILANNAAFPYIVHQTEEKIYSHDEIRYTKKKDPTAILMEITDNFCESTESIGIMSTNVFNSKLDTINRKGVEIDDAVIVNLDLSNIESEKNLKDPSKLISLEPLSDNQIVPKLDRFIFTKSCEKQTIWKEPGNNSVNKDSVEVIEPNTEEGKNFSDGTSEYKENSIIAADTPTGKIKQKKKSALSNRLPNKNKGTEEQAKVISQEFGSDKSCRNSKSQGFETILNDALLSEQEFLRQDTLTNADILTDSSKKSLKKQIVCNTEIPKDNDFENLPFVTKVSVEIDGKLTNDAFSCDLGEDQILSNSTESNVQQSVFNKDDKNDDRGQELRRSSRNSKRITSYNETDLIDPLLDDIDNNKTISKIIRETTKDIFGVKRKSRKFFSQKKMTRNGQNEKKLDGEELFDLLKTTPNENIVLSKPSNTFFNSFEEISADFNDDNFDVLEDILEKSIAVIEEDLSEPVVIGSEETVGTVHDLLIKNCLKLESGRIVQQKMRKKCVKKKSKKFKSRHKNRHRQPHDSFALEKISLKETDNSISDDTSGNLESEDKKENDLKDLNEDKVNKIEEDKSKRIYCEICNKSFCRVESLTKHKRTLTHISKLSELEAMEAALKTSSNHFSTNEEIETTRMSSDLRGDLNLVEMMENEGGKDDKPFSSSFSVSVTNTNLKLADIINDVLNKPLSKKDEDSPMFEDVAIQNEKDMQNEIRRCKSLAERKSFESETHVNKVEYFESEISNAATGTILEKQITLLENIIENRPGLDYIEELSISSTPSANNNVGPENEVNIVDTKQTESVPVYLNESEKNVDVQSNIDKRFLKPSQYEEISEDSNLKNYEEQKSRKALNRDEELFLECCSLLKSGSEVSSYSKKSNNFSKDFNKRCDESDWLESNCLSKKQNGEFVECYSDSSRIRTPLGDSFSQEDSDSATISSHWEMENSCTLGKKELWKENVPLEKKSLTFEEVFNNGTNEDIFCKRNNIEDLQSVVSSFDRVISEVLNTKLKPLEENKTKSTNTDANQQMTSSGKRQGKDAVAFDRKKVLTKGAMKVFEGLKVSIPTEELNIEKILISGSSSKTNIGFDAKKSIAEDDSDLAVKTSNRVCQTQNRSVSKSISNYKKKKDLFLRSKVHDIYDFEETQDNSDVLFTKPDFRSFRINYEKYRKIEKSEGSDDDSNECSNPFSFDALSSSTSSVSEVLPNKSRTRHNITKKKCMIMGRIFKNAVKARIVDEDIRNIPVIDNTKLVENFVLNCPGPDMPTEKKNRMTEEEMNLAFDKLVNDKSHESKQIITKTHHSQTLNKNVFTKRNQRRKSKKRIQGHSSSDDEFKLQKFSKKHPKKKNSNTEDSCINLEQELRECIGVASRKSQRKCTSGKQNVLIEYWSSDESSFEPIEKQMGSSVQKKHSIVEKPKENCIQISHCKEVLTNVNESISLQSLPNNESETFIANSPHKIIKSIGPNYGVNRRKRAAANPLYHWSSSSEDESRDLIMIRPARDENEDEDDRPVQHGWIVGDSPKKLVTMLAQAKGKKCDVDSVKEHGRKRTSTLS